MKSLWPTFLWAAACLWTTRAAHVAAALLRAALAAANAEQHDQQQAADDDEQDCQPIWNSRKGDWEASSTAPLMCAANSWHLFLREIDLESLRRRGQQPPPTEVTYGTL